MSKVLNLKFLDGKIVSDSGQVFKRWNHIQDYFLDDVQKQAFQNCGDIIYSAGDPLQDIVVCIAVMQQMGITDIRKQSLFLVMEELCNKKGEFIKIASEMSYFSTSLGSDLFELIDEEVIIRSFSNSLTDNFKNIMYYSLSFDGWVLAGKYLSGISLDSIELAVKRGMDEYYKYY